MARDDVKKSTVKPSGKLHKDIDDWLEETREYDYPDPEDSVSSDSVSASTRTDKRAKG